MLLSFVVVTQEGLQDFEKTINSINNQSLQDYEIIIVMDRPSHDDNNDSLVKKLFAEKDNVKVVFNSSIQGSSLSWNLALDLAEGKYIKFFKEGDFIAPNFVEVISENLEKNKDKELDIIEYKIQFTGNVESEILTYLDKGKVYEISKDFDPYAYTNPLLFNKIFRTKLIKDFGFKFRNFVRYDMLFVYKVLGQTEYYLFIDSESIEKSNIQPIPYSVFDQVNQWTHILNYYRRIGKYKHLKDYLNYSYYKTLVYIWLWEIKKYDNKLLIKKATNFAIRKFKDKRVEFTTDNTVFLEKRDERFTEICVNFDDYIKEIHKVVK